MNKNKKSLIKNIIVGMLVLGIIVYIVVWLIGLFLGYVGGFVNRLSNMDAVVIVALITGSVSILGVVISSIVSKIVEYRQNTKRYLYEKKEEPYSEQNDNTENRFMLKEIIFEIRKDMGQKKSGLEKGDILAFFVNDIEDYLPKDKKK